MARKRYGRNQRRQHREEIARLTEQLAQERVQAENLRRLYQRALAMEATARAAAYEAEDRAFERFMRATGLMKITLEKMAHAIGHKLGEELRPVAKQILAASRPEPVPEISLGASPVNQEIRVIRGALPAIHYSVAVTNQEMELYRG